MSLEEKNNDDKLIELCLSEKISKCFDDKFSEERGVSCTEKFKKILTKIVTDEILNEVFLEYYVEDVLEDFIEDLLLDILKECQEEIKKLIIIKLKNDYLNNITN